MSDPRRGVVLVTVLWLIALLSALAMAASITFRGFAAVVAVDRYRVRTEALLTAGLEAAAHTIEILGDTPLDQLDISVILSTGSVRAHMSDEGGRIDIGKAPVEVLAALFRSLVHPLRKQRTTSRAPLPNGASLSRARANAAAGSPDESAKRLRGPAFHRHSSTPQIPGMAPEWITAIAPLPPCMAAKPSTR